MAVYSKKWILADYEIWLDSWLSKLVRISKEECIDLYLRRLEIFIRNIYESAQNIFRLKIELPGKEKREEEQKKTGRIAVKISGSSLIHQNILLT